MKNLFKIISVQLLFVSALGIVFAQQQNEEQQPAPIPAQAAVVQSAQSTQALTPTPVPSPVQKDDKRSLTVMTTDTPGVDIGKKDLLTEIFAPVGDVMFGFIKTSSDVVGGACQGCVDAFEGTMKFLLTPFGFKPEHSEKRVLFS